MIYTEVELLIRGMLHGDRIKNETYLINLRGKVIPVIDLRVKLDLPKKEHDNDTRIIVVDLDGKTVGFLVDAVSEVLRIPKSITEPPPSIAAGINSEYITAVGKLKEQSSYKRYFTFYI